MSPHIAGRPHPMRSLLILAGAALAFALAQTMLIPALGELTHQLDTDASGIAWVLTGYLLAAAVSTPIAGRLGDMFGKRRLLVLSLVAFGAGSSVAALGTSLEVVVAGPRAAGLGGGIFPLCFGIIRDEFPREKVAGSIGLISAIFGIGGGAGLVGGGLIADNLSYHWIFWLGAISAALAAIAAQLWVPESPSARPGGSTCAARRCWRVGLVLPLIAISRANDWGWGSARTLGLIAAGLAVLAIWVAVERRTEQPLADIPTLLKPPVLMTNIATLLVGFGMFGSFLLIPQLAEAPDVDGLRLRPRRHRRRAADAARLARDAGRRAALGRARHPLRLEAAARARARRSTSLGLLLLGVAHGSELAVVVVVDRDVRRHRPRLRGDGEPDRGGRPAQPDRRGDRASTR